MKIADRMDRLYSRGSISFEGGPSSLPTPIEIGQVPLRKHFQFLKLSDEEQALLKADNKCFECKKEGCRSN